VSTGLPLVQFAHRLYATLKLYSIPVLIDILQF